MLTRQLRVGFDNISLDKTETDIIAQIDFAMKREGYEMSFDTMVLTGDNAANPHGIPGATRSKRMPFSSLTSVL